MREVWIPLAALAVVLVALLIWASWGGKRRQAAAIAKIFQQEESEGDASGATERLRLGIDPWGRHTELYPDTRHPEDGRDPLP
jgi:hypothetical protein